MVDYSKWRDIEISDDEDETHPNIDTASLFRWRHQARLDRMAEINYAKEQIQLRKQSLQARLVETKERLKNKDGDEAALQKELEDIQRENKSLADEEEEVAKREKKTPWNVDTISKPGFQKTILNQPRKSQPIEETMTEKEKQVLLAKFMKENDALCKEYALMRKYDDSMRFLQKHSKLVCEETANYLVVWCINLAIDEKHELVAHVAHQCICLQYILELAKQLHLDPRSCISSFFTKIQECPPDYRQQFESEVETFQARIKKRAAEKIREAEEEERQARLGPGGLDPEEVFEELPDELKKCFEERDVDLLRKTIASMPLEAAKYHMKRCVDSGLWVSNDLDDEQEEKATTTEALNGDKSDTTTKPQAKQSSNEKDVTSIEEVD